MKSIALANPQALFAYAVGVVGSHMCFLYTWSRQGSCGVVPGPLLVFLIAPLNLWTSRDPHTSQDTRRRSEGRRLQRQQSSLCCSYLQPLPNNHTSPNKGQDSGTVHAFLQHKPCSHNHADKWKATVCIKAYKLLLRTLWKQSGDHSLFFYC